MNCKVTVLMSVYNEEIYLRDSIESILNQTFQDFEFLIFDDCSTDGSKRILKEYEKKDKRITLILNKINKGLSYNLAEGVLKAKYSWIARMDADDIAYPNRLELQLKYVEEYPNVDIVGGYVTDINEKGVELGIRKVPTSHNEITSLIWTCPIIHPTVLYRKEGIIKVGSYDRNLRRRQDYDLWFRCCAAQLRFGNLNTPLLYYRFTDEYFKKNDLKVQLYQLKMGIKGAKLINASSIAYIGIIVAFLKGTLPYKIRKPVNHLLRRFDPRRL